MIPDYGKIHTVGHRDLRQLFDGEVVVQEKVDGSQFSAFVDEAGTLHCRSKCNPLDIDKDGAKGLFAPSIQHLLTVKHNMVSGWTYRFEAMAKAKHNVLAYERAPAGNLVLYDLFVTEGEPFEGSLDTPAWALAVEPVQEIFRGITSESKLQDFLAAKPQLGGAMAEGVVIKNYALGLKGKFVAPRFQEIMHNRPAKAPKEGIVQELARKYCSEARWEKAIAHLREAGTIGDEAAVKDIGPLIREVQRDVLDECGVEIREALFEAFAKDLRNGWIAGLPEFYKRRCP